MDCERKGASYFRYEPTADKASFNDGPSNFTKDLDLTDCQPSSGDVFTSTNPDVNFEFQGSYDRGHLLAGNHLGDTAESYVGSYRRTNATPRV